MIFIVDAGNTNVSVAIYKDELIIYSDRCDTIRENIDQYYIDFFGRIYDRYPNIDDYVISSVVPMITDHLIGILRKLYKKDGMIVNSELVSDLKIDLHDRNELGADLIATTYGALNKYQTPIIVADLGTATKISVIDTELSFKGGLIIPGVSIAQKATEIMIPHLPQIKMELPEKLINSDTITSMQAGLLYGTIYQVKGLVLAIEMELKMKATKVLTGGYSRFIASKMSEFVYDEHLLMDGLLTIYHKYHI